MSTNLMQVDAPSPAAGMGSAIAAILAWTLQGQDVEFVVKESLV